MAILNRTQEERVLNWIRSNGEITSATAYNELGIIQLPKRIWNLKRMGYTIKTEWREGKTAMAKRFVSVHTLLANLTLMSIYGIIIV